MYSLIDKIKYIKELFGPLGDKVCFVKNTRREYVYANQLFLDLAALELSRVIYDRVEMFLDANPAHVIRAVADDHALLAGKVAKTGQMIRLKNGRGEDVVMHVEKLPLYDECSNNRIIGILGVGTDKTADYKQKLALFKYITEPLSAGERRQFFLHAQGLGRAEIARALNIDPSTVDSVSANIRKKITSPEIIEILGGWFIDMIDCDIIDA